MPLFPRNDSRDYGVFSITRDVVSNTLTTSDLNIMQSVGNGLVIEDVLVSTDGTGLAGGTNFQIKVNGIAFFAETVANLGANKFINLTKASVTGTQASVEGSEYITVNTTAASGTGAGIATVIIRFRKLDVNSSIVLA